MGSLPSKMSASRGAAILGKSKWSTRFEVFQKIMEEREPGWNIKHGYLLPEFEYTPVMEFGHCFEDAVIKLSEESQGLSIGSREKSYTYKDVMTCHIDGKYKNGVDHEGKTTSPFVFRENWGTPGTDRIPEDYTIQVAHQQMCDGAEKTIVSVLVYPNSVDDWLKIGWEVIHKGKKWYLKNKKIKKQTTPYRWAEILAEQGYFHQYPIARNQALIDSMEKKYLEFWHENILPGIPPDPVDYDDLKRMLPHPKGTIIASDQVERWCYEYKECGAELGVNGNLQKRRDQLKVLILDWMRKQDPVMDEESQEKTILKDTRGHNLIGYNGKVFR